MSYEPHVWVAGETVTPSKLNHLEQGVAEGGGGVYIVECEVEETEDNDTPVD